MKNKDGGICIRSDLLANREQQPGSVKKALRERWGIYRPVEEVSANAVIDVLSAVKPEVEEYLKVVRKGETPSINVKEELGVTFVKARRVGQQLFRAIRCGFNMGRAIERLDVQISGDVLTIPLDLERFAWSPVKPCRKALARFATSMALDKLLAERTIIDTELSGLGLCHIVDQPDHLTLFDYGYPGDKQEIKAVHKREVLQIVSQAFSAAKLGSISLKPLNIGPNYNTPCELWQIRCETAEQPELVI